MSDTRGPITELDLVAYVDDQLDLERQIEVEAYLAREPDAAARIMADLRTRDALRLGFESPLSPPSLETMRAARRLERGLVMARLPRLVGMVAAVLCLIGIAWFVGTRSGPIPGTATATQADAPGFLEEAVMSHKAALVRARMRSQPETTVLDPREIRVETRIAIPSLPRSWRIQDVQVFPSDDGLSVQISADAGTSGALSLFAIHRQKAAFTKPSLAHIGGDVVAFWAEGAMSYALIGSVSSDELKRVAEDLADNPVL